MKLPQFIFWLVSGVLIFALSSCYRAPEFPVEPHITFNNLKFYDVDISEGPDSLVVTINFEDGDGDLGVAGNEVFPPFHPFSFVTTEFGEVDRPGNFSLLKGPSSHPDLPPFNCVDYRLGKIDENSRAYYPYCTEAYKSRFPLDKSLCGMVPDTFYVKPNIYAYNFLVDFLVKEGDSFKVFDWNEASASGCADGFWGTFPILFDPNSPGKPLSGELSYNMESFGFVPYFRNSTLKLRIQIIDRALHMSNIIETPEFSFERQSDNRYTIRFVEN